MPRLKPLSWLIVSFLVVIVDQLSKYAITQHLTVASLPLLPHLNLIMVHNTGAAFSILASSGEWQRWFFIIVALFSSSFLVVWLQHTPQKDHCQSFALAVILGGAIANLIDRVSLGYVIDFIDFYIGNWHFATFNIADSAITLGAILLILLALPNR